MQLQVPESQVLAHIRTTALKRHLALVLEAGKCHHALLERYGPDFCHGNAPSVGRSIGKPLRQHASRGSGREEVQTTGAEDN
eukprot:scaffold837_cov255-Pinguiococcus_pyrenoidosus.AAC.5